MADDTSFTSSFNAPWVRWQEKIAAQMREALKVVAEHTAEEMAKPKSGENWVGKYEGMVTTSSATDEYPAVQQGDLVRAITDPANHVITELSPYKLQAEIKVEEPPWGVFLDEGFEHFMSQEKIIRPWKNRAWVEMGQEVADILGPKLVDSLNKDSEGNETKGISVRPARRWD